MLILRTRTECLLVWCRFCRRARWEELRVNSSMCTQPSCVWVQLNLCNHRAAKSLYVRCQYMEYHGRKLHISDCLFARYLYKCRANSLQQSSLLAVPTWPVLRWNFSSTELWFCCILFCWQFIGLFDSLCWIFFYTIKCFCITTYRSANLFDGNELRIRHFISL